MLISLLFLVFLSVSFGVVFNTGNIGEGFK